MGTAVESVMKETDFNEAKEVERRIVQINNQKLSSQNELGNYLSIIGLHRKWIASFLAVPNSGAAFSTGLFTLLIRNTLADFPHTKTSTDSGCKF